MAPVANDPRDIAASAVIAALGDNTAPTVSRTFSVMGTTAHITLVGATELMMADLHVMIVDMEHRWSRFRADSEISRLNWAEGAPVTVSTDTAVLIQGMRAAHTVTRGVFDPTILPRLVELGYAQSRRDASMRTELPASATYPGDMAGVVVNGDVVTMPRGTAIDPGGIGKGFAADMAVAHARELGALGAMVEIGGDLRIDGEAPDGTMWRIGIENPFVPAEHMKVVALKDGAVATSSRLKRVWDQDGVQHNHLLDSLEGQSIGGDVVTVSVIAATATRAEVLTKPGFVWPVAEYLRWLPTVAAAGIVVLADGTCIESDNWSDYE